VRGVFTGKYIKWCSLSWYYVECAWLIDPCRVKQESDYLHHGSGGAGLDADSKFTKQDWMRSQKNRVCTPLVHSTW